MPDDIRVDISELVRLSHDLAAAPGRLNAAVVPVVKRGALNVKRAASTRARLLLAGRYAPAYPSSINYDVTVTHNRVVAEIGPDKGKRQGALGNLIEYGSANNAPIPHLGPAGVAEEPRFRRNLIREGARAMVAHSP